MPAHSRSFTPNQRQNLSLLQSILCLQKSSTSLRTLSISVGLGTKQSSKASVQDTAPFGEVKRDPKLIPSSLRQTLDAHRDANRASVIRKVPHHVQSPEHGQAFASADSLDRDEPINSPPPRMKSTQKIKLGMKNDYRQGKVVELTPEWAYDTNQKSLQLPWMDNLKDMDKGIPSSGRQRLDDEIRAFEAFIAPTEEEVSGARAVFDDIQKIAQGIQTPVEGELIGSRANGLAAPLSDVDVNLPLPPRSNKRKIGKTDRRSVTDLLWDVHRAMSLSKSGSGIFEPTYVVASARVPICYGIHIPTGLKYQISCTGSMEASLAYVRAYQDEFPTLRTLFLLFRHMLQIRGLDQGSAHGIGGYPTLIMLVAALKFGEGTYDRNDTGSQLLFILNFYTQHSFEKYGISVQPPKIFSKSQAQRTASKSQRALLDADDGAISEEAIKTYALSAKRRRHERPYLMCLIDPANPFNDLGSSAWRIKDIQVTLLDLRKKLNQNLHFMRSCIQAKNRNPSLIQGFSLLRPLVGADYTVFNQARAKLRYSSGTDPWAAWDKAYAATTLSEESTWTNAFLLGSRQQAAVRETMQPSSKAVLAA
ncbi:MAG: hypothetical protein Q9227_006860 [Pyrenula ochraceoflavens]